MNEISKQILPTQIGEAGKFWEFANNHEFCMQKCNNCGYIWWPPGPACPKCWCENFSWTELSGKGEINTWVIFHRSWFPEFEDKIPYNVAEVTLEEGPRYLTNIINCENEELYRGKPVKVVFEQLTNNITLPKFSPLEHEI